jgi:DNA-binding HxlR family transcriptional regulator
MVKAKSSSANSSAPRRARTTEAAAKKESLQTPLATVSHMVEEVVGCKWSFTVLGLITTGVSRPGAMQRRVRGLTAKVLNERLKKLLRFGIIERQMFAEVPPRVEYRLTSFGKRFNTLMDHIATIEQERDVRST